jgi:GNAT superfamily N-acetyltransferase
VQDVIALQKMESNRIGFLPKTAILQHVDNGWCVTAIAARRVVGYVLGWHRLRYAPWCRPVTQLVVHPLMRRLGIARQLLDAYADLARKHGQTALQAWTRVDLHPAHALWHSLKWTAIATRSPTTISQVDHTSRQRSRKKPLVLYRLSLTAIRDPQFLALPTRGGANAATILATAIPQPD